MRIKAIAPTMNRQSSHEIFPQNISVRPVHPLDFWLVQLHLADAVPSCDEAGRAGTLVPDVGVAEPELAGGTALVR